MCGIFGVVSKYFQIPIDASSVAECIGVMAHRGPDASGFLEGPGFCFGHRRLSVIDIDERANQPFQNFEKYLTLVFNGTIFNFRELRQDLEKAGAYFRTQSDTEVLLYAYSVWGINCLSYLNGAFAFAIHDERNGETFLARDRLGVKPLYYKQMGDQFLFASDPSAILRYPGVNCRVNLQSVSSYLSYRSVLGESSLYDGIQKLLPGHYLRLRDGTVNTVSYWDIDLSYQTPVSIAEMRELISDAVTLQLVSDAPIAVLLSGGIDSSILAYETGLQTGSTTVCYTARVPGDDYDETHYAREVAQHLKLQHFVVDINTPNSPNSITEIIDKRSHPLGMHNETALYSLAQEVALNNKVVLTGEGADEIFAGYSRLFRTPFDYYRKNFFQTLQDSISTVLCPRFFDAKYYADELAFFLSHYNYFPTHEKLDLMRTHIRKELEEDHWIIDYFGKQFMQASHRSFFDRISYVMTKVHLPALLEMIDGITMAAGLDARVPFTDHRLVQSAINLPEAQKLKWRSFTSFLHACILPTAAFSERADISKFILKQAYREELPNSVIIRRKKGFPIPLGAWAVEPKSAEVRGLAFGADARISEIFNMDLLRNWYKQHAKTSSDVFGKQVWLICNLELYLRRYFD